MDGLNRANSEKLQKVLGEYGVDGKVTGYRTGPIVTLYEFVPNAGIKARFTIANVVARSNAFNVFGGWSIVDVYKNIYESMRDLTVFDGFGAIGSGPPLDIPISGFNTPLSGPVSLEIGVIVFCVCCYL